jgi:cation diffusion facilitator CzcD-associated flavoprotein CzcO
MLDLEKKCYGLSIQVEANAMFCLIYILANVTSKRALHAQLMYTARAFMKKALQCTGLERWFSQRAFLRKVHRGKELQNVRASLHLGLVYYLHLP